VGTEDNNVGPGLIRWYIQYYCREFHAQYSKFVSAFYGPVLPAGLLRFRETSTHTARNLRALAIYIAQSSLPKDSVTDAACKNFKD